MSPIGQPERTTQNRVLALFRDELGYRYLGDWTDRAGNSNIEEGLLTVYLTQAGYTPAQISRAIYLLKTEADNHSRNLYRNNQAVYNLLRYGVPVKTEAGKVTETVHLINWHEPDKNGFAIAVWKKEKGSGVFVEDPPPRAAAWIVLEGSQARLVSRRSMRALSVEISDSSVRMRWSSYENDSLLSARISLNSSLNSLRSSWISCRIVA